MHPTNVWFICITIIVCVGCISFFTAQASIEDSKQEAFMMKVCVEAGGQWEKSWRQIPSCLRPSK